MNPFSLSPVPFPPFPSSSLSPSFILSPASSAAFIFFPSPSLPHSHFSLPFSSSIAAARSPHLPPSPIASPSFPLPFRNVGMKARIVLRKLYDYIRYDLKEIAFPSSLPDPPHVKKRRKLTWHERFLVLKEASRLYAASWVRDIGPDLRPNDYKVEESENKTNAAKSAPKVKEPSTLEDLAVAARGGMETLKPALQRVYMTRASAYRDALKNFIDGYQEGIQQVVEKKEVSDSQKGSDIIK